MRPACNFFFVLWLILDECIANGVTLPLALLSQCTVTMYNNSLFLMNDKLTMHDYSIALYQEFIHKTSFDKVPIQNIPAMYPLTKVHAKGNHKLVLLIG